MRLAILQTVALLFLLLAPASLRAQCTPPSASSTWWDTFYSKAAATTSVVTIQQPATGASRNTIQCVTVYCELACTVTFSMNGTAATATALTVNGLNGATPNFTAYRDSDVGAGTTISPAWNQIAARTRTYIIELSLTRAGTANNFTTSVAMASGVIQIAAKGYQQ